VEWYFLVTLFVAFGLVGAALGSTVNKGGLGFLIGACLGPIGWVIVLLLPRTTEKQAVATSAGDALKQATTLTVPKRNLNNDTYKIWLGHEYGIKKNELFEKYECMEKLFDTLQLALEYADTIEASKRGEEVSPIEKIVDWREQLEEARKDLGLK
jgi:hypothetical protein